MFRYPLPPRILPDEATHRQVIAERLGQAMQGRLNVVGDLEVAVSAVSTSIIDPRINPNAFISFMAQSANEASFISSIYFTAIDVGTADIAHNTAVSAMTIKYVILG